MKIVAIGDIHGRNIWMKIVEKEHDADKIIFVGDYFDSRDGISSEEQIINFNNLINFKKENMGKVILLLGNHDFSYLKGGEPCSGYQHSNANIINEVLQPAVDSRLIQVCHRHGKYIFSHAGITKTWLNDNNISIYGAETAINNKLITEKSAFKFNGFDNSGDDVTQSPIWVRIPSLLSDPLDGYTFVIGHTTMKQLQILNNVICIDTLGTSGEYLLIEDRNEIIQKILD